MFVRRFIPVLFLPLSGFIFAAEAADDTVEYHIVDSQLTVRSESGQMVFGPSPIENDPPKRVVGTTRVLTPDQINLLADNMRTIIVLIYGMESDRTSEIIDAYQEFYNAVAYSMTSAVTGCYGGMVEVGEVRFLSTAEAESLLARANNYFKSTLSEVEDDQRLGAAQAFSQALKDTVYSLTRNTTYEEGSCSS